MRLLISAKITGGTLTRPMRQLGLDTGGSSGGNKMHHSFLNTSNWIQIASVIAQIFIAVIALFSVYIAYLVTKKFIGPKLNIEFNQNNRGLCHKTRNCLKEIGCKQDYYFRFYVENTGKSMAKHCEIVAEKLWHKDPQEQSYHPYNQFAPVNLNWTGGEKGIIDINPRRKVVGNIGHIPEEDYQNYLRKLDPYCLIDLIGKEKETKLRFILVACQF